MTYIQIYWTCANLVEAKEIASYLVEKKLVACANIIPQIESIFMWKNNIDTQMETLVLFKTKAALFDEVEKVIRSKCSYEVPAILQIPLEKGSEPYFKWLDESTK